MTIAPSSVVVRDYQLQVLDNFVDSERLPDLFPSNVVVQGFKSSGKSYCVREYFKSLDQEGNFRVFVTRYELFSWKNLLTSVARISYFALRSAFPKVETNADLDPASVEDFYLLVEFFTKLFQIYDAQIEGSKSFYVIIDNLDSLPQIDFLVFARLVKAHESMPFDLKLKLKFLYTIENVSFYDKYRTFDLPLVVFPRYTQDEILKILELHYQEFALSKELKDLCLENGTGFDKEFFCKTYLKFIVESFYSYTGSDVDSLKDLAILKWPSYLQSITKDNYNNAAELYKKNIPLWTNTGDSLESDASMAQAVNDTELALEPQQKKLRKDNQNGLVEQYELSNLTKYILISVYLASFLDQKSDNRNFSKKFQFKRGKGAYGSRVKQKLQPETMKPVPSTLERLLAILQAIFTFDRRSEEFLESAEEEKSMRNEYFAHTDAMKSNVEVYESFAELVSLKLVLPSKVIYPDLLDSKTKWKANLPWETMLQIAKSVNFDIEDYFEFQ
ncbi:hypothetical protein ACO0QE_002215 [Hanseniaspora vineae]